MRTETEPMDIDGDVPLTVEERRHIRRLLRDDDRTTWAMKKLRVLMPIVVGAVVAAWQIWDWAARHIKVTP
jgi:hypothetical protein